MSVKGLVGTAVNRLLAPAGLQIVRARPVQSTIGGRSLTDLEAIQQARRRGVSVGHYLEEMFGQVGRAQSIVDRLQGFGAVSPHLRVVCEIGPGSGLYIEKLLKLAAPHRYEIYEIARSRAEFLANEYPVVAHKADGMSLAQTATGSVDLVHAHGVLVSLPFLTAYSYFKEIVRVTAPRGHVAFDIISEDCLDDATADSWLQSNLPYPSLLSKAYVTGFFQQRGFTLLGEARLRLLVHGYSCYLVFRRGLP